MERAVGKVRKERAELLAERRRQDIMDMDKECSQPEGLCVYIHVHTCSTEFSPISAHHHIIISAHHRHI